MRPIFGILCTGAAVFMLRILGALLKERKNLSPQAIELYFAKFNPVKPRGELIVMNSKSYVRKSAVETGKRAALIVVAAALLTLPLHGQQAAKSAATDASGSVSQSASTRR